jgi:Protein of unknown function (DUF2637)
MNGILRGPRRVALAVIAAVLAAASAVALAESYRGLYDWARGHGLPGGWAAIWPLQVDTFLVVGELALFVALVDRWPARARVPAWAVTLAGLAVSVAGNIGHVHGHDVLVLATAAVPPLAAASALAVGLGVLKRVVEHHHEWRWGVALLPDRIRAKIVVNPESGCWEWQSGLDKDGYGRAYWEGQPWLAHRLVFTLLNGPIPEGLTLDHVRARGCLSKACCWPFHLDPVTWEENNRRQQADIRALGPSPKPVRHTPAKPKVRSTSRAGGRGPDAAAKAIAEAIHQGHPAPSARALARDHHIGRDKATEIRAAVLAEADGHGGQPGQLTTTP